ncbi:MAG: TonB family protein [Balneolaceae bacterium]
MLQKKNRYNLKQNYALTFELGFVGILLISIGAAKIHFPTKNPEPPVNANVEKISLIQPPVTKTIKIPPSPMLPIIPQVIPDDSPIDPPTIDFGNFDDYSNTPALPPEPLKDEEEEVLDQVEFMPQMRGGIQSMYQKIKYPEVAKRNGIEGRVVVEFIINENGEVENPVITRSIGGGCDEEVLRVIKLQKFTPGIQNGRMVKVRMRQMIQFKLQ